MVPYFIANLIAVLTVLAARQLRFDATLFRVSLLFAAIPLIVVSGMKNITVGTDTVNYVAMFDRVATLDDAFYEGSEQGEIGYWLMCAVGHMMTDNYAVLFTLAAIVVTACYFCSIRMMKTEVWSLATLLFIGPYYAQVNINRQAVALALFSLAVVCLIKRRPVLYAALVLIGFLFHRSCILWLPLYPVFHGDIKPRRMILLLAGFAVFVAFFQTFISLSADIAPRYATYGESRGRAGGAVFGAFNLACFVWFCGVRIAHQRLLDNRTYDVLLSLYFLGTLISLFSTFTGIDPSGFLRLSQYFTQVNMFLLPLSLLSFQDVRIRTAITLVVMPLMVAYFYLTMSTFGDLTPYEFNL